MNLKRRAFFSRFAHIDRKNGSVAYYHSLGMRPIFLPLQISALVDRVINFATIEDFLEVENDPAIRDQLEEAVKELIDHKIIIPDPAFDDEVIKYFRGKIPDPYIQVAFFVLTDACNFNCKYCFIEHDRIKNNFTPLNMSWETAKQGLDYYCEQISKDPQKFNERKAIQFYGGEPLLRFDVMKKLLRRIEEYKKLNKLPSENLEITCITNGALLTDDVVKTLKDFGVGITISIDGDQSASVNRRDHRNNQVYQQIIDGINLCKKYNAHFALSITITEESLKDEDAVLTMIDELKPNRVGFNTLISGSHFKVSEDYHKRASDFVLKAFDHIRSTGVTYEDNFVRKVSSFAEASVCVYDCGAVGGNQIIIMPDGNVGLCEGFIGERKFITSDIYDTEFDPKENELYKEWGNRMPLKMEACQNCIALGICGGGCLVSSYKNKGTIWELNEKHCYHIRNSTRWLIWDTFKNLSDSNNFSLQNKVL